MFSTDLDHGLFLKNDTNKKINETATSPFSCQEILRRFVGHENTLPFSHVKYGKCVLIFFSGLYTRRHV
jgi:hypothetical protein